MIFVLLFYAAIAVNRLVGLTWPRRTNPRPA